MVAEARHLTDRILEISLKVNLLYYFQPIYSQSFIIRSLRLVVCVLQPVIQLLFYCISSDTSGDCQAILPILN